MGFGWLLMGYFFSHIMTLYSPLSFAMLVGYPMMIYGLFQLAHYHDLLKNCFFFSFLSLPFAVYFGFYGLHHIGLLPAFSFLTGTFFSVVEIAYFAFTLLFQCFLLYGISGLTRELQLMRLQGNAWRNFLIVIICYLVDGVARLPIPWMLKNRNIFTLSIVLMRLAYLLLIEWLIFKCYRHICSEDEDQTPPEMPQNPFRRRKSSKKEEDHE